MFLQGCTALKLINGIDRKMSGMHNSFHVHLILLHCRACAIDDKQGCLAECVAGLHFVTQQWSVEWNIWKMLKWIRNSVPVNWASSYRHCDQIGPNWISTVDHAVHESINRKHEALRCPSLTMFNSLYNMREKRQCTACWSSNSVQPAGERQVNIQIVE